MPATVVSLPAPSSRHATCPWCSAEFGLIEELLSHVELAHVGMPEHPHNRHPLAPAA